MADTIQMPPPVLRPYIGQIAVGQTQRIQIPGNFFTVKEADWDFQISFGGGQAGNFSVGLTAQAPDGAQFTYCEITNTAAEPLNIELWFGLVRIWDNRLNIVESRNGSAVSQVPVTITNHKAFADPIIGTWALFLPADPNRAEVWLWTDAVTTAYWCADATAENVAPEYGLVEFNNIVSTADFAGFVKLKTKSAIYIRPTEAGTYIRARVFCF